MGERHPPWWQLAADYGRTVGLYGAYHAREVVEVGETAGIDFVVPDRYAVRFSTRPKGYEEIPTMARRWAEWQTVGEPGPADLLRASIMLAPRGVKARSIVDMAKLAVAASTGRAQQRQLRGGWLQIQCDVFVELFQRFRPRAAVWHTDHVAVAVDRFGAAMDPGTTTAPVDPAWVRQHANDVPMALQELDKTLAVLDELARGTGRTLVVVATGRSIDQRESSSPALPVVVDTKRFLDSLGVGQASGIADFIDSTTLRFRCRSDYELQVVNEWARNALAMYPTWRLHPAGVNEDLLIDIDLQVIGPATVSFGAESVDATSFGIHLPAELFASHDQHVRPRGILAVGDSATFSRPANGEIDELEIAPAFLANLGVPKAAHHQSPTFGV